VQTKKPEALVQNVNFHTERFTNKKNHHPEETRSAKKNWQCMPQKM